MKREPDLGPTREARRYQGVIMEEGERGGVQFRVKEPLTVLSELLAAELLDIEHGAAARHYCGLKEAYEAHFCARLGGNRGDGGERTMADDYLYIRRRVQTRHLRAIDYACFSPAAGPLAFFAIEGIVYAFHRLVEIRKEINDIHKAIREQKKTLA